MKTIKGNFDAKSKSFAIVISRFNGLITHKLLEGAVDCLERHGAEEQKIATVWVPGAFEIPLTAQKLAQSKKYHAIICLGAVIKGQTSHYLHIATQVTQGINRVALETGVPVVMGVITTENLEQAIERAGTKMGNRGFEAAMTAIEMANVMPLLNSK